MIMRWSLRSLVMSITFACLAMAWTARVTNKHKSLTIAERTN